MYKGKWELTENDRKRLSIRWYDLELHVSEEVAALTWHRGIICYNEQPIQHPDVVNVIDVFGYYSEDAQDEEKEIYEMVVTYTDGFSLTLEPLVQPLEELQQVYAIDFWFNQATGNDRREMDDLQGHSGHRPAISA